MGDLENDSRRAALRDADIDRAEDLEKVTVEGLRELVAELTRRNLNLIEERERNVAAWRKDAELRERVVKLAAHYKEMAESRPSLGMKASPLLVRAHADIAKLTEGL